MSGYKGNDYVPISEDEDLAIERLKSELDTPGPQMTLSSDPYQTYAWMTEDINRRAQNIDRLDKELEIRTGLSRRFNEDRRFQEVEDGKKEATVAFGDLVKSFEEKSLKDPTTQFDQVVKEQITSNPKLVLNDYYSQAITQNQARYKSKIDLKTQRTESLVADINSDITGNQIERLKMMQETDPDGYEAVVNTMKNKLAATGENASNERMSQAIKAIESETGFEKAQKERDELDSLITRSGGPENMQFQMGVRGMASRVGLSARNIPEFVAKFKDDEIMKHMISNRSWMDTALQDPVDRENFSQAIDIIGKEEDYNQNDRADAYNLISAYHDRYRNDYKNQELFKAQSEERKTKLEEFTKKYNTSLENTEKEITKVATITSANKDEDSEIPGNIIIAATSYIDKFYDADPTLAAKYKKELENLKGKDGTDPDRILTATKAREVIRKFTKEIEEAAPKISEEKSPVTKGTRTDDFVPTNKEFVVDGNGNIFKYENGEYKFMGKSPE